MSLASPSFPSIKLKLKLKLSPTSSSSSHPWKPPNRQRRIVITNSNADGPLRRPAAPSLSPPPKPTPPPLTPSPKPALPSLSGPPSLAPPPKPTAQPPTPAPAPAPAPVQAKVAGTDLKGVVTLEYQRKIAKELQDYFKQKKLEEADQGPAFGFTAKNEISNGRWAMFGFAVGLLTEYATGSDFVQQMKILLSNFGIVDLE